MHLVVVADNVNNRRICCDASGIQSTLGQRRCIHARQLCLNNCIVKKLASIFTN